MTSRARLVLTRHRGAGTSGRRVLGASLAALGLSVAVAVLAPGLVLLGLAVAAGVALSLLLTAALAATALRWAGARVLDAHPHLALLGRRFETTYDGARVVDVRRHPSGAITVGLMGDARQTVQLDEDGVPDTTSGSGAGRTHWAVPAGALAPHELDALLDLQGHAVVLVDGGAVGFEGPVVTDRRLTSDSGLVVQSTAPRLVP